jgi:hypothetical protein
MAANKLGLKTVPCVFVEGLSEAQRRAYILADNKLTEMGEWDVGRVQFELAELNDMDFNVSLTGFELDDDTDWFESRKRYDNDLEGETDEYKDFVEKFEPKKTTDDCYTPDGIYDVVATYVEERYNLDRKNFIRPFYPNGDYQKENYPEGSAVVDNPPFSIMSEIIKFYTDKGVKFFLFAPSLVGLSETQVNNATMMVASADITYENGAFVQTSFTTNLEGDLVAKTCPDLHRMIEDKDKEIRNERRVELPKYAYPSNIVTMAMMGDWANLGIEFEVRRKDCTRVGGLDAQKEQGKAIFGGGLLLSEKARIEAEKARIEAEEARKKARIEAEKAKPRTVWQLSEREQKMVEALG